MILFSRGTAAELCDVLAGRGKGDDLALAHEALRVLLHEVAHLWFGGTVRDSSGAAADTRESLAEYVAQSSLPPEVAEIYRQRALTATPIPRPGLAQRVGSPINVLSYQVGPEVLWRIADRIGTEKMVEVLRHYVAENRDRDGSWTRVFSSIEAVAGADAAAWAKPLIFDPVLPEIR